MTSIAPGARLAPTQRFTQAAPDAPAATGTDAATERANSTADGIVVNDHATARMMLRIGGGLAAAGGIGAAIYRMSTGGLASAGSRGVWPLAVAGAAVGAGLIGSSFVSGLQPKTMPFAQSNIPSFDEAVKAARKMGDDVAIFRRDNDSYALVDFKNRDFDNEDTTNIDLGNKRIPWSGLVSQDGDLFTSVSPTSYTNVGRADPKPIKLAGLTAADAPRLVGERIGTTDTHQAGVLGSVVGDAAGYATRAEAAAAAVATPGATAMVKLSGRYVLMNTTLPNGASAADLSARGAGLDPVSDLLVQDGKKLFSAASPGRRLGFAGRATPFATDEPVGFSVAGRGITAFRGQGGRDRLISDVRADAPLVDAVLSGRVGGAVVLKSTDPDGTTKFSRYETSVYAGSRGSWDTQLAQVEAELARHDRSRSEYSQTGFTEYDATIYRTDYRRSDVDYDVAGSGTTQLRTTGWVFSNRQIDWFRTNELRTELRNERLAEEERRRREEEESRRYPPAGGGVSPGDDRVPGSGSGSGGYPGGGVSHGDDRSGGSSGSGGYPGGGVSGGDE